MTVCVLSQSFRAVSKPTVCISGYFFEFTVQKSIRWIISSETHSFSSFEDCSIIKFSADRISSLNLSASRAMLSSFSKLMYPAPYIMKRCASASENGSAEIFATSFWEAVLTSISFGISILHILAIKAARHKAERTFSLEAQ